MRSKRPFSRFFSVALACFTLASSVRAQLLVVATPGEPAALEHAEVAFASGAGTPVTWLSLRIRRGPVAVVAALRKPATSQHGLDAWFSALERTASQNVLPPAGATDCGNAASFVHVAWPRSPGLGADELELKTAEDVAVALEQLGLSAPQDLPGAERYVVWSWPDQARDETTRTLRIVGGASPLTFVPSSAWPVSLNTITRGPVALPGEAPADELRVTFVAGEPGSDYRERLQDWLQAGKAPLVEARQSQSLFGWSILADKLSLPPLVRSYALAAAGERKDVDADTCTEQLQASSGAGAPSATACGDAEDAGLALAAVGAGQPVLQRFVLSSALSIDLDAGTQGGEPSAPVLRADGLDDSACPVVDPPPPVVTPPISGGVEAPPRGGGETTVVVEETTTVDEVYSGDGCSCGPGRDPYYDREPETGACSSDTSSSSDDSCSGDSSGSGDDSCSSDSSSSSSSDDSCSSDSSSSSSSDDSCSSDSSSSSSGDSGCGSDSSSSSSSDDGCSGSSDSSYDGDTCTGRAAPGAEPSRTAQARLGVSRRERPQRLRVSLWSMALSAMLLPIRRRKRERVR
jgi:hypothetical protein